MECTLGQPGQTFGQRRTDLIASTLWSAVVKMPRASAIEQPQRTTQAFSGPALRIRGKGYLLSTNRRPAVMYVLLMRGLVLMPSPLNMLVMPTS